MIQILELMYLEQWTGGQSVNTTDSEELLISQQTYSIQQDENLNIKINLKE